MKHKTTSSLPAGMPARSRSNEFSELRRTGLEAGFESKKSAGTTSAPSAVYYCPTAYRPKKQLVSAIITEPAGNAAARQILLLDARLAQLEKTVAEIKARDANPNQSSSSSVPSQAPPPPQPEVRKNWHDDDLLTRSEAADFLRVAEKTLANQRWAGTGPRCVFVGRSPRYRFSDLKSYAAHGIEQPSARAGGR